MASPRMDRLEGGASSAKQEVAGVGARHASPLLVLLAEEEEDKGGGGGLGRLGELGRAGKQVSGPGGLSPLFFYFVSLFYFCSFVSDLVYSPNHFNKSCK